MGQNTKISLQSFSTPDVWYEVDRVALTCTCEGFAKEGYCKHLEAVGAYKKKGWYAPTHPTFSQALSGLVKCIRLRKIQEAIYWLVYLDHLNADGGRFRIARRLLIGSAEDGHSVSVMERVSQNFPHLCDKATHIIELAAEVVRICKVPNWWDTASNGPEYIRSGMIADRRVHLYNEGMASGSVQSFTDALIEGINTDDQVMAIKAYEQLVKAKVVKTEIAKMLGHYADQLDHTIAKRLVNIHLTHKSPLSGDNNFLCQAVWMMAGGQTPVADTIHKVLAGEVKEYMHKAYEDWKTPHQIPGWCCDGIHCGGVDRRFAGIWHDMDAVCTMFKNCGEVDTDKEWTPDLYSLEGLDYKNQ